MTEVKEPIIAWDLLTPILNGVGVGIILFFVNRMFGKRDERDKKNETLKSQNEALREINVKQWRDNYSKTLCEVKTTVERIEDNLNGKADQDKHDHEVENIWAAISEKVDKADCRDRHK